MRNFKSSVLLVLCILFGTLTTIQANKIPAPTALFGVGVDIIQGFNDDYFIVQGTGCGNMLITVYDSTGALVRESPILNGDFLKWQVSTINLSSGVYVIRVNSVTEECVVVRSVLVK